MIVLGLIQNQAEGILNKNNTINKNNTMKSKKELLEEVDEMLIHGNPLDVLKFADEYANEKLKELANQLFIEIKHIDDDDLTKAEENIKSILIKMI